MKIHIIFAFILFVAGCKTIVVQQNIVTSYHDIGTNGQQLKFIEETELSAVELTMYSNSWDTPEAKAKGSDVLVLIMDSRNDGLISYGVIYRQDIPNERNMWVRCKLNRTIKLKPDIVYILKVVSISSGGKKGWNEYGFAKGDKYPDGMLIEDFNSYDKMDYAFKLIK